MAAARGAPTPNPAELARMVEGRAAELRRGTGLTRHGKRIGIAAPRQVAGDNLPLEADWTDLPAPRLPRFLPREMDE